MAQPSATAPALHPFLGVPLLAGPEIGTRYLFVEAAGAVLAGEEMFR